MARVNQETVEQIVEHHFGRKPRSVVELSGGLANFVYEVHVTVTHPKAEHPKAEPAHSGVERFIVRISDDVKKLSFFLKEQWAVAKAREHKVPAPEILEVGNQAASFPYMIVKKIEGLSADLCPTDQRQKIIKRMGKWAATINSISTSNYGHEFDWSSNTLSKKNSWKDFLEKELDVEERLRVFEKHKMMSAANLKKLKEAIEPVKEWKDKPSLNHGDMRLKNLILDEKGKIIAILDWENCISGIAPQWELSIALHDLSLDEKELFLEGYGLSQKEYEKMATGLKVLNILNYAPIVLMMIDQEDKKRLEWMRVRLAGDLDLFSL